MANSQAYANLTASDGSTSLAALGSIFEVKGAAWMYGKASATVTQYQAVVFDPTTGFFQPVTTTLATATAPQTLGVAQFAFASGDYGWVAVGPFFLREDDSTAFKVNNGNTSSAAAVKLYTHATAGYISDQTASSAVLIPGIAFTATATTAGTAYAITANKRMTVNNS